MKQLKPKQVMQLVGFAAIIVGGLLSAALAHQPSQFVMWFVAYAVLVIGVGQLITGTAFDKLQKGVKSWQLWAAIISYNLGSLSIIAGRFFKDSYGLSAQMITVAGTMVFMLALALLLMAIKPKPGQLGALFYALMTLLLVSAPVGIILTFIN